MTPAVDPTERDVSRQVFLYDPPERFVAGTVGLPGRRTFFLQASGGGRTTSVVLEKAQGLPSSMREAGAFRLEWRGPAEPLLAQATYRFRRGEQLFDMFIVPVARDTKGTLYEAIFN